VLIVDGPSMFVRRGQSTLTPEEFALASGNYPVEGGYESTQTMTCANAGQAEVYHKNFGEELRIEYDTITTISPPPAHSTGEDIRTHHITIRHRFNIRCEDVPEGYELTETQTINIDPDGSWEGGGAGNAKGDDVYTKSVTDGDGRVLMVVINGQYFPENQFIVGGAAAPEPGHTCNRPHYHAHKDDVVFGLDGSDSDNLVILPDIRVTECGFGLYDDLERVNIPLSEEQRKILRLQISSF